MFDTALVVVVTGHRDRPGGADCHLTDRVSDERSEVRREVLAELVELAERHRAGHEELYHSAVEHGREEMQQRAYANWHAGARSGASCDSS